MGEDQASPRSIPAHQGSAMREKTSIKENHMKLLNFFVLETVKNSQMKKNCIYMNNCTEGNQTFDNLKGKV